MDRTAPSHPYWEFEFAGWEQAASAYADTFELATRLYADALLDAVNVRPGEALLDDACGAGFVAATAASRGAVVIGADFSPAMLAQARRLHPTIRFDHADAEALPYGDGTFDAVVINFGLHHFPFPERALSEIRRVLRPDGRVACTVWSTPERHALQAIALEAVRSAGGHGAALPVPPRGALNTIEGCLALLRGAGLNADEAKSALVERRLRLPSVSALTHLIESGTVRLATLLRSQPQENRAAILRALASAAAKYTSSSGLSLPVVAVLVVGQKTAPHAQGAQLSVDRTPAGGAGRGEPLVGAGYPTR
jgi:ubiquinone/menaquinone biosynthesis C-methylase UbiE